PTIIDHIGVAFAPIGGVFLAHYAILSRMKLSLPDLFDTKTGIYRYVFGVNPIAVGVVVAVYLFSLVDIFPESAMPEFLYVIVAGLLYIGLMVVVARLSVTMAESFDSPRMSSARDSFEIDGSARPLEKSAKLVQEEG